jgi:hypothetical protein
MSIADGYGEILNSEKGAPCVSRCLWPKSIRKFTRKLVRGSHTPPQYTNWDEDVRSGNHTGNLFHAAELRGIQINKATAMIRIAGVPNDMPEMRSLLYRS